MTKHIKTARLSGGRGVPHCRSICSYNEGVENGDFGKIKISLAVID